MYNIKLVEDSEKRKINGSSLLSAYARRKGYISGSGLPNEALASRFILKEVVNGRIVHAKLPPDYDETKE